jgi:hypothetical protein
METECCLLLCSRARALTGQANPNGTYKFGVLFCRENQSTEDELYGNGGSLRRRVCFAMGWTRVVVDVCRSQTHTDTQTHRQTHTHRHTDTHTHTHTHTQTHRHTQTHTDTHSHSHLLSLSTDERDSFPCFSERRALWLLAHLFTHAVTEESCPAFDEFLSILGERTKLAGFTGFKGGLDLTGAVISHAHTRSKGHLRTWRSFYAPARSPMRRHNI